MARQSEELEVVELASWHLEDDEPRASRPPPVPPPRDSHVRLRDDAEPGRTEADDDAEQVIGVVRSLMWARRYSAAQAVLIDELLRRPRQVRIAALLQEVRAHLRRAASG